MLKPTIWSTKSTIAKLLFPAAVASCCELINGLLMMQHPVPEQRGCAAAEGQPCEQVFLL